MKAQIFSYSDADPSAIQSLQDRLVSALRHGYRLVLDLDSLPVLDNPALRGLILMLRRVREAGGSLALFVTRPEHRRILALTALDRVFEVAAC